jgi:predicted ATPase/DNA-binding CsgD family transcriptional regulator/DNA-binding XRE family transcriptional regulator
MIEGQLGFGALLRRYRLRAGLTQAALAAQAGVSRRGISDLERGLRRAPYPNTVKRLATAMGLGAAEQAALRASRRTPADPTQQDSPSAHNLPASLNSFVGRELELTRLIDRLGSARLLTLTGAGGVGKTRLALEAGKRLLHHFRQGVWLVELASVADPDLVPNAVAAALSIRERGRTPLGMMLVDTLRDKHLLLVLDNCEHLLDGSAALVHDLLQACENLTILATSREPLRISGELTWPVQPLALSADAAPGSPGPASEAVQLFVERARAADPDFELRDDFQDAVTEVCTRLDGLPLAIELAAARIRSIPVRTLLHQLQVAGGLPLLSGGPRDAPARQRTLRSTITWSYELLDPDEQTLFRRLAPFRGCTLEAVDCVCVKAAAGSRSTLLDLPLLELDATAGLASLVDKCLLHVEEDERGVAWYWMLETVREFALEQLESSPEAAAVWRRHAWYYLQLAEQKDVRWQGVREDVLVNQLEREHGNFRAALDWCQDHGYAEVSLRLAIALLWFWGVRGHITDGRNRLEALLARFPLRAQAGSRAAVHARALDAAARLAAFQGDFAAATALEERSLHLARSLNDTERICDALEGLALVARECGDYSAAQRYLDEFLARSHTLAAADELANPAIIARLATGLTALGELAHEDGDDQLAASLLEQGRSFWLKIGDSTLVAQSDIQLGAVALDAGDYERARKLTARGLSRLERSNDRQGLAIALALAAHAAIAQRDFAAAHRDLCRGLRINQEIGGLAGIAFVLVRFAFLASAEGQPRRALRLAGAAAALRRRAETPLSKVSAQRLDQQLAPAREALGPLADAAMAEGTALTLDAAIAEALATSPVVHANRGPADLELLSPRERQVAALIGRGYSNRRVAVSLVVGQATVATHVQHILTKLGLQSRAQIAVWSAQHGLLDEPSVESSAYHVA